MHKGVSHAETEHIQQLKKISEVQVIIYVQGLMFMDNWGRTIIS
jgi:hypothetical protein